jgi:hypothetical protein
LSTMVLDFSLKAGGGGRRMILQPATPKSGEDPGGAHPARSPLKLEKI